VGDAPIGALLGALVVLLLLSAFFSGSETGLMAINRYRLRHLEQSGHPGARRVSALLARPDRLIGLILVGNNFVNILASALATVIGYRLLGELGIALATGVLTLVLLVFSEVTPKTLAALAPERVAFPASYLLQPLQTLLYPLVWLVSTVSNGVLRLAGFSRSALASQPLSREELRTVLNEAAAILPQRHQQMLVGILDLERVTVDDVMVPRTEIVGLDLEAPEDALRERLVNCQHTRVPLYRGDVGDVVGILHVRRALNLVSLDRVTANALGELALRPYFIPGGTPLATQLLQFQRHRQRLGLVVNEYGDVEGLVTLDDILEEVVGEFTTQPEDNVPELLPQPDGTCLIDAGISVRDLNRALEWTLPTDGPKTLNGLILEYLETIPEPGTSLRLEGHPLEVVQTSTSGVRTVRVSPALPPLPAPLAGEPP
jgi:Mg2+/Co2+ transporter CorB